MKKLKMKATSTDFSFDALVELCRRTHEELRRRAIRSVDTAMVVRNWLIGWYIVEYEQTGADRAKYGSRLIERLAAKLHLKGTSATNLRKFRQFYREFPIQQTLSVESVEVPFAPPNWQTLSDAEKVGTSSPQSRLPVAKLIRCLSYSHLEDRLLDKLQEFMLELGHGFCFEARVVAPAA